MTGEVINLRRARKRKARSDAEARAAGNRVAFGVSRADKALAGAVRQLDDARLLGHRRDDADRSEP